MNHTSTSTVLTGLTALAALTLTGCAAGQGGSPGAAAADATPSPTVTVTVTATPPQSPRAGTETPTAMMIIYLILAPISDITYVGWGTQQSMGAGVLEPCPRDAAVDGGRRAGAMPAGHIRGAAPRRASRCGTHLQCC